MFDQTTTRRKENDADRAYMAQVKHMRTMRSTADDAFGSALSEYQKVCENLMRLSCLHFVAAFINFCIFLM